MDAVSQVLARDSRIAYALLFGSAARGTAHAASDLDVAVGVRPGVALSVQEVGLLVADLERAAGGTVDLVVLDEATPPVAYRVFRDGVLLFVKDHGLLTARKARAILDYLDFRPLEEQAIRGALSAASRG